MRINSSSSVCRKWGAEYLGILSQKLSSSAICLQPLQPQLKPVVHTQLPNPVYLHRVSLDSHQRAKSPQPEIWRGTRSYLLTHYRSCDANTTCILQGFLRTLTWSLRVIKGSYSIQWTIFYRKQLHIQYLLILFKKGIVGFGLFFLLWFVFLIKTARTIFKDSNQLF